MKEYSPEITVELLAYLDGELDEQAISDLRIRLEESPELQQYLNELAEMQNALEDMRPAQAPETLNRRLLDVWPADESPKRLNGNMHSPYNYLRMAAMIVFLCLFGLAVYYIRLQNQEISKLAGDVAATRKMLVLAMLSNASASERIQAVNYSQELDVWDRELVEALLSTLHNDPTVNVRIKAAEALVHFGKNPEVLPAMIQALREESRPEVQISLIDALVTLKAKNARPAFQELSDRESSIAPVKLKAREGMAAL